VVDINLLASQKADAMKFVPKFNKFFDYFSTISAVELLICIKFGTELFAKTEKINIVMWLVFQVMQFSQGFLT
jgi:hypothetical protein